MLAQPSESGEDLLALGSPGDDRQPRDARTNRGPHRAVHDASLKKALNQALHATDRQAQRTWPQLPGPAAITGTDEY